MRACQVAEGKGIHEALHPETRAHVAGGRSRAADRWGSDIASDNLSLATDTRSFAKDAATKLGVHLHTVERSVQIGKEITEDVRNQIVEIDLNLVRLQYSPYDESIVLAKRQDLAEALRPEIRADVVKANAGRTALGYSTDAHGASVTPFTQDVAAKSGRSRRSIQERTQSGSEP